MPRPPLLPRWAGCLMAAMWLVAAGVSVTALAAFVALTAGRQWPTPGAAWAWYVQHASP